METRIYQILSKIDSYMVILQFFCQGRDEIFSCGFRHDMCPSSGEVYLKAFPLNPYQKKVVRQKPRGGSGNPLGSRGLRFIDWIPEMTMMVLKCRSAAHMMKIQLWPCWKTSNYTAHFNWHYIRHGHSVWNRQSEIKLSHKLFALFHEIKKFRLVSSIVNTISKKWEVSLVLLTTHLRMLGVSWPSGSAAHVHFYVPK